MGWGASVQVVMTRTAERFVGRATFSGLTQRSVFVDPFESPGELHVELAARSDLVLVAPATADLIARAAAGRCGDLVTALLACARCPVVIAPAMHPHMWESGPLRDALSRLERLAGWHVVGPAHGEVASGAVGRGRMVEPDELADEARRILRSSESPPADLCDRTMVVTAGPTVEDLDPVRCLTNRSSGKMGYAIAAALRRRGADVLLISGPVQLPTPPGVRRVDVRSALDMQGALQEALRSRRVDAIVMCAAVSDYRPRRTHTDKLKRRAAEMTLDLVQNPDLLSELGHARQGRRPLLLGFAVETLSGDELVAAARRKLLAKRCDAVVANSARDALGTDETSAKFVTAEDAVDLGRGSKVDVARAIAERLARGLQEGE